MPLRRYTHLLPGPAAAPAAAGTLWEALIEAHHDTAANGGASSPTTPARPGR